jgi:hypothetical protein
MTLGADIKEVYTDVGAAYSAVRSGPGVSGEIETGYLDFELNRQVTKPFIREYFIEASLPYDSETAVGDVIEFTGDGRKFLLMNLTPDLFENEVFEYQGVLYKCNILAGKLERSSGEVWDTAQTYQKQHNWHTIDDSIEALVTESLFGHSLETDVELGMLGLERHELYIPASYGIKPLDRFTPVSGEWYMITTVKSRRYDGIDVAELETDTR